MAPLVLITNLATRWRHLHSFQFWPQYGTLHWLQIWPPDGDTCIRSNFGPRWHLALVANSATRWHHLHWFQRWPPGNVTCIATLPWIALWHYQLVLSLYPYQLVSPQLSFKKVARTLTQFERSKPIDWTPGTPGSDKKVSNSTHWTEVAYRFRKDIYMWAIDQVVQREETLCCLLFSEECPAI